MIYITSLHDSKTYVLNQVDGKWSDDEQGNDIYQVKTIANPVMKEAMSKYDKSAED